MKNCIVCKQPIIQNELLETKDGGVHNNDVCIKYYNDVCIKYYNETAPLNEKSDDDAKMVIRDTQLL